MDTEITYVPSMADSRINPAVPFGLPQPIIPVFSKNRGPLWRQNVTKPKTKARTSDPDEMGDYIVSVAKTQDKVAFKALFSYFAPRLNSFLLGQRTHPQMAEEIVQETLVNVWRKAGQFDPDKAAASTWVFTIARNLRIDHLRKINRPEPDMNDPAFQPDPEPQATDILSVKQDAIQLKSAIDLLPDEQRAVLQLAFFQDKSHPEVAEQMGIPLGTVKSRIRLALARLRSELGETQ